MAQRQAQNNGGETGKVGKLGGKLRQEQLESSDEDESEERETPRGWNYAP